MRRTIDRASVDGLAAQGVGARLAKARAWSMRVLARVLAGFEPAADQLVVVGVLRAQLAVVVDQPAHGQAARHPHRAVDPLVGAEHDVPHRGGDAVVGRGVAEVVVEVVAAHASARSGWATGPAVGPEVEPVVEAVAADPADAEAPADRPEHVARR